MVSSNWATLFWVAFLAVTVRSADIVYVTDIELITYLVCLIYFATRFVVLTLTSPSQGAVCFQCDFIQRRVGNLFHEMRRWPNCSAVMYLPQHKRV